MRERLSGYEPTGLCFPRLFPDREFEPQLPRVVSGASPGEEEPRPGWEGYLFFSPYLFQTSRMPVSIPDTGKFWQASEVKRDNLGKGPHYQERVIPPWPSVSHLLRKSHAIPRRRLGPALGLGWDTNVSLRIRPACRGSVPGGDGPAPPGLDTGSAAGPCLSPLFVASFAPEQLPALWQPEYKRVVRATLPPPSPRCCSPWHDLPTPRSPASAVGSPGGPAAPRGGRCSVTAQRAPPAPHLPPAASVPAPAPRRPPRRRTVLTQEFRELSGEAEDRDLWVFADRWGVGWGSPECIQCLEVLPWPCRDGDPLPRLGGAALPRQQPANPHYFRGYSSDGFGLFSQK
ncbi:uncharacterized protein GJ701_000854 [Geothlypis trichas]